ncbi:MAG: flagellar motor switch protein FliN [Proteobacteria bacterium]|nr:flagellar motor switch protein FliN [Pseudomonadota bacterium]NDC25947.1 flagellar motor switch protein FliN [Pseudomonadota bacterium]NDD05748.1 flagellar motor switch protein FliN [Pseudomonadota bacterium]NDG25625.1 flagellar motor switch protein FliN [Pseudomonadota bacterium]
MINVKFPMANNETEGGSGTPNLKVVPEIKEESQLQYVLDIPLRVSVELGRTKILVQDLIKLHKGSVIELSKIAGEALEVLVNDKVVAKGEVIVVNEKFGVRLTDIVSNTQRIRQLGELA